MFCRAGVVGRVIARGFASHARSPPHSNAKIAAAAALAGLGAAATAALITSNVALAEEEKPFCPFDAKRFAVPSYRGEVAIVTGGSTGIGAATCKTLANAGARVFSIDIHPPPVSTRGVEHVQCDVSDVQELKKRVNEILAKTGDRVDLLVSNAGVWCGGPIEDVTEAQFDKVLGINVKGTYFAIQAVVPSMQRRGNGAIIIVGSDQSLVGKPGQNLYGLTKGAIAQLSKSCAAQFAPEGIRVNCVCPGTVDTPLMHNAVDIFSKMNNQPKEDLYTWLKTAQPFPRLGTPEEVGALIACVAKIPFVCGAAISVDGGYTAQ